MTVKITDTTMRDGHQSLLAGSLLAWLAATGLVIVGLSFVGWAEVTPNVLCYIGCPPYKASGASIGQVTSMGDGYVTAALGLIVAGLSAISIGSRSRRAWALWIISAAGLGAFGIAARSLTDPTDPSGQFPANTAPTLELYVLTAIGAATAVLSATLLAMSKEHQA